LTFYLVVYFLTAYSKIALNVGLLCERIKMLSLFIAALHQSRLYQSLLIIPERHLVETLLYDSQIL